MARAIQKPHGAVWSHDYIELGETMTALRTELEIPHRRNGLRHAFVSAHFAVHADEGMTSMQAGNSPAVVHKNYKGLMTKKEGEAWFRRGPSAAGNLIPLANAMA